MSFFFNNYLACAKEILHDVGKTITIGVPLGLGKPIGLLNALFQLAKDDASINLTIITGLTLARPFIKNELEKRLVEPILDRVLKDYEDPLYEKYRELQQLPKNIKVIEFFLAPGKFLNNAYVQQNYISSSYTTVSRDVINLSINIIAQQVAPSQTNASTYSLSCNTDLFHELKQFLDLLSSENKKIAIVAEVNANLPYMYGMVAEVHENIFSHIVDEKKYRALFAIPREELSIQDHFIGLYTSSLIKDDSCLQIGIGKLSNALANSLMMRQKNNDMYRSLINQLNAKPTLTYLDIFSKGLYASTEMLSDEYLCLYKEKILKKRVYDHEGLQYLLNNNIITETITPDIIDKLIEHRLIHAQLTDEDVQFLKYYGIFKKTVQLENNTLIISPDMSVTADLTDLNSKQWIIDTCLGDQLKSGKIIHAGFFIGSVDFYSELNALSYEELQCIEMVSIARTNALSWSPKLLQLQRKNARFVNSSLMVTLVGEIISDGLKNYQELSGVGGQFDFVNMATQLPHARSIINCRSTRQTKNKIRSNIVWDYPNCTIPRYLRDIIVTEYGIADCRSKTDAEVIKAILNIADSRFQLRLLKSAKKAGKISFDYQIPGIYRNNYPEALEKMIKPLQYQGYFQPYPFGDDLTPDEKILSTILLYLKNTSKLKLFFISIASLFYFRNRPEFDDCLKRMKLKSVNHVKDYFYKKLLQYLYAHLDCHL